MLDHEFRLLFDSVAKGDAEALQSLLKSGADASLGSPSLPHMAVIRNSPETLRLLLDASIPVDSIGPGGATPLMFACSLGISDMVDLLVSRGADLAISDNRHWTALAYALEASRSDISAKLMAMGSPVGCVEAVLMNNASSLATGCSTCSAEEIQALIELSATHNSMDCLAALLAGQHEVPLRVDRLATAFFAAIEHGLLGPTTMLVSEGIGPSAVNSAGTPAIVLAAELRHADIAALLLDSGADTNAADAQGRTALMWAAKHQLVELVDRLLRAGAAPWSKDKEGLDAEWWANGYRPIVDMLRRSL